MKNSHSFLIYYLFTPLHCLLSLCHCECDQIAFVLSFLQIIIFKYIDDKDIFQKVLYLFCFPTTLDIKTVVIVPFPYSFVK